MKSESRITKYSIPFNGDLSLMEEAFRTGRIYEVYFNTPVRYDLSSIYPKNRKGHNEEKILKLLGLARRYKVKANLLLNSPLLSFLDIDSKIKYVHRLKDALSSLTIADPYQIKRFKKQFPHLEIEASVIMNLDTYTKIEKMLSGGVDVVNIPLDLNRNAKELGKIAGLKRRYPDFKIKLLANHICFYGCPFMQFHYFLSEVKEVFKPKEGWLSDFERCMLYPFNLEELIKRPFIRPEDISFYKKNGYADIFKICFRTDETSVLRKTVFSYLKESYTENLLDIITNHGKPLCLYWDNKRFPQGFIEKVASCDKSRCVECKYCKRVSKKVFKKI